MGRGRDSPPPFISVVSFLPFFLPSFFPVFYSFFLKSNKHAFLLSRLLYLFVFFFFFYKTLVPSKAKPKSFSSIIKVQTKLHANTEENVKQTPFQKHRRRCTEEEALGVSLSLAWEEMLQGKTMKAKVSRQRYTRTQAQGLKQGGLCWVCSWNVTLSAQMVYSVLKQGPRRSTGRGVA